MVIPCGFESHLSHHIPTLILIESEWFFSFMIGLYDIFRPYRIIIPPHKRAFSLVWRFFVFTASNSCNYTYFVKLTVNRESNTKIEM